MKAKKIMKAFKLVRKQCKGASCSRCPFSFRHDSEWLCALRFINSKAGWEAFQIGVKEVFK